MSSVKRKWVNALGIPSYKIPDEPAVFIKRYEYDDFDLEVYTKKNDIKSSQRVMIAFPKNIIAPSPAVVIPFYYPEAMLGFDPETDKTLENYSEIAMMKHLVKRGYITASADAYHLTYPKNIHNKKGFELWEEAGKQLKEDNPDWTGMGKLVSDTTFLIDVVASNLRVDTSRIGIAGHSLGGKMAFYTGCLDERIKVILASDFGMKWEQSNWGDIWYWHKDLDILKENKMDHSELLSLAAPKPFCLIAGEYDDKTSFDMMCSAKGYTGHTDRLKIINHATGHRPPEWALNEGYEFIDRWL